MRRAQTSLLVDLGNQRFTVVGPDLRFHRTVPADAHGGNYAMDPIAVDRSGRFYFAIPGWAAGPAAPPGDSVHVTRFDPSTSSIDRLGQLQAAKRPENRRPLMRPRLPYVIYSPRDAWAVTPDGRVAFIRSEDYHVEWMHGSQPLTQGHAVATDRVRITHQMREEYIRSSRETGVISGRGPDGGLGAIPKEMLTPQAIAQGVEDNAFADYLPTFDASAVFLSPTEALWVGRYPTPGHGRTTTSSMTAVNDATPWNFRWATG